MARLSIPWTCAFNRRRYPSKTLHRKGRMMRIRWLRFFALAGLWLAVSDCGGGQQNDAQLGATGIQGTSGNIFFDNQITKDGAPACIFADPNKLVSLFNPDQQTLGPGMTGPYTIAKGQQFGLQVNFWYWTQTSEMNHAIGTWSCSQGQCNNPDNSGAQFTLGAGCSIASMSPPVFGVGKETYIIADISAAMQNGECVVTIKPNQYTGCVTPACCDFAAPGQCAEGTQGTYAAGCATPPP